MIKWKPDWQSQKQKQKQKKGVTPIRMLGHKYSDWLNSPTFAYDFDNLALTRL